MGEKGELVGYLTGVHWMPQAVNVFNVVALY